MKEAQKILSKYWGHTSFRPLQEEIITKVTDGGDVLALLPTGGGKSLCFQIPALLKPGICIVISPLVALMQDQVNALKEKGIKAMAITGGIPFSELDTMLDNCIYGNYKFLYLSPERLQQELVKERIRQMDVNLIAIDEAHCISQWGHDFRPAYRNIKALRELKPEVNFIGLTASATRPVQKDIVEQLELQDAHVIKKTFARENIAFLVSKVQDKNFYLERLVKEHEEAVIIYVRNRKATEETAAFLTKKGVSSASYHGGISRNEKSLRLQQWLSGEKRVMVATSAFGMGIDKATVRSVIHLNLPESLESYFQEAGRAGRDGLPAKAVILTNDSDIPLLKNQFLSALPDVGFVKKVYRKLVSYFRIAYGEGEGTVHDFNFLEFCNKYEFSTLKTYNTLQLMDRASVIQLSEQFQKKTRIQFLISSKQLSFFLEANPRFVSAVKAILRTYGGAFENKVDLNLQIICSKAGINFSELLNILTHLKKEDIIDFEHDQHDARLTFLVPREDETTINPLAPYIKLQAESKSKKISSVLQYVDNDKVCRSEQLLRYFGETETHPCGICSVCLPPAEKLTRDRVIEIYHAIIGILEVKSCTSGELTEKLPFAAQHITKVLKMLVEREAVSITPANQYKLKHL